jgi:hypothetical protein
VTQPCPTDFANTDHDDAKDGPDLYGKIIDGVSDGMHLIIASFIKANDKIRGQLLKSFAYFSEVMCANINGLKFHLVFTGKPLPDLTSAKDANMPTTRTKVRDYFFIQNQFSLVPETCNKPKNPYRKLMLMGASNLMRTNNSMDLTELQA